MKKVFKRISAIAIVMSVFMCSSLFVFAAVCDNAPDDVHHFTVHKHVGGEYLESVGPHTYLYGYDAKGNEIFRNDCQLSYVFVSCEYKCLYCSTVQSGSQHRDMLRFNHSISHN